MFLPGESHGQRSKGGGWGERCRDAAVHGIPESDTAEPLSTAESHFYPGVDFSLAVSSLRVFFLNNFFYRLGLHFYAMNLSISSVCPLNPRSLVANGISQDLAQRPLQLDCSSTKADSVASGLPLPHRCPANLCWGRGRVPGRRSLVGCRLWGHTESVTTEVT